MRELTKEEQIDLLLELNALKDEKIDSLEMEILNLEDEHDELLDDLIEQSDIIDTLEEALSEFGVKVIYTNDEDEDKCEDCKCNEFDYFQ